MIIKIYNYGKSLIQNIKQHPINPSIANINTSSTPLFFISFKILSQYLEVSFSPIPNT